MVTASHSASPSPMRMLLPLLVLSCLFLSSCEKAHISPHLTITMRGSLVRGGVLQLINRSRDMLECQVYVKPPNDKRSNTYRFVIESGEMREVGYWELDGWYIDPGETAYVSVSDYLLPIEVHYGEDGRYHVQ